MGGQLNKICSTADYKSKLNELRLTVKRIEAVLKDAEAKQELSEQERLYIEQLKDAVYEADDLFDEFVTLAERKQLTQGINDRVLSVFTKFGTAYNMSQKVTKIKSKLDAIAYDKCFSLSIDPKPIKNRRPETCSYVYDADDIIGRGLDLEKIVGVLLDSNVQKNVSFLSIVGIGRLGKTALAQLVYNNERFTTAFSLKMLGRGLYPMYDDYARRGAIPPDSLTPDWFQYPQGGYSHPGAYGTYVDYSSVHAYGGMGGNVDPNYYAGGSGYGGGGSSHGGAGSSHGGGYSRMDEDEE